MTTILLTGGSGFIGKHLAAKLADDNFEVISADKTEYHFNNKFIKSYKSDISKDSLDRIFTENKIDYVIHLAAQISVRDSVFNPENDAQHNILGTLNLIKYCKKYNIKKLIAISTSAVYGEIINSPATENSPIKPLSPYAVSKLAMENYIQISGLDFVIIRYSNIFGKGQNTKKECGVISIFIEKMLKNEDVTIYGDGNQTRDFLYINDAIKIIEYVLLSDIKNDIINYSGNAPITINELFQLIADITGYKKQPVYKKRREGEIKFNALDNTKAKTLYNLIPTTTLEEGIREIIKQSC